MRLLHRLNGYFSGLSLKNIPPLIPFCCQRYYVVPGVGELIGGSQREERLDVLLASMEENGLEQEEYEGYLDIRRFGTFVHSGYGLGFERAVMYMTGMKNIRDVIPYPRTPKSVNF